MVHSNSSRKSLFAVLVGCLVCWYLMIIDCVDEIEKFICGFGVFEFGLLEVPAEHDALQYYIASSVAGHMAHTQQGNPGCTQDVP